MPKLILSPLFLAMLLAKAMAAADAPDVNFPILSQLARFTPEALRTKYVNTAANITSWRDDACPSFLFSGDLLVCGNLFVRGKLTVLTAANVSVFEEPVIDDSEPKSKTGRLSRFAAARCTKVPPTAVEDDFPSCTTLGDLVLPKANLLISGSVTTFGSIVAGALIVDGAASVAAGVASFLNVTGSDPPRPAPWTRRMRGKAPLPPTKRRSEELDVWPPLTNLMDPLCPSRIDKVPEALFLPKGYLFVKNRSSLFTFGGSAASLFGIDRAGTWISRCGTISSVSPDEQLGGEIALLAASVLVVSGQDSLIKTGSLVVSQGSSTMVQGSLQTLDVCKGLQNSLSSACTLPAVSVGSDLSISGNASLFNLVLSDGAEMISKGSLTVTELLVVSGAAELRVGGTLQTLALELYDQASLKIRESAVVESYLAGEDGVTATVVDGNLEIGGVMLLANSSTVILESPQGLLSVGEDVRAKSGARLSLGGALVGCSFYLDQHSEATLSGQLRIRQLDATTRDGSRTPAHCDQAAPILYVHQSRLHVGDGVRLGGRRNYFRETEAPTSSVSIFSSSQIELGRGGLTAVNSEHVLLIKSHSKLDLGLGHSGTRGEFRPGRLLSIEGGSRVEVDDSSLELQGLQLSAASSLTIRSGNLNLDWTTLKGKSQMQGDMMVANINSFIEAEERSRFRLEASTTFGPVFNHLLSGTGSRVIIGQGGCDVPSTELRGDTVAQDAGSIKFTSPIHFHNATFASEGNSFISFECYLHNPPMSMNGNSPFRKTEESSLLVPSAVSSSSYSSFHPSQANPLKLIQYKVKVPSTDSSSLQAFSTSLNKLAAGTTNRSRNHYWTKLLDQTNS